MREQKFETPTKLIDSLSETIERALAAQGEFVSEEEEVESIKRLDVVLGKIKGSNLSREQIKGVLRRFENRFDFENLPEGIKRDLITLAGGSTLGDGARERWEKYNGGASFKPEHFEFDDKRPEGIKRPEGYNRYDSIEEDSEKKTQRKSGVAVAGNKENYEVVGNNFEELDRMRDKSVVLGREILQSYKSLAQHLKAGERAVDPKVWHRRLIQLSDKVDSKVNDYRKLNSKIADLKIKMIENKEAEHKDLHLTSQESFLLGQINSLKGDARLIEAKNEILRYNQMEIDSKGYGFFGKISHSLGLDKSRVKRMTQVADRLFKEIEVKIKKIDSFSSENIISEKRLADDLNKDEKGGQEENIPQFPAEIDFGLPESKENITEKEGDFSETEFVRAEVFNILDKAIRQETLSLVWPAVEESIKGHDFFGSIEKFDLESRKLIAPIPMLLKISQKIEDPQLRGDFIGNVKNLSEIFFDDIEHELKENNKKLIAGDQEYVSDKLRHCLDTFGSDIDRKKLSKEYLEIIYPRFRKIKEIVSQKEESLPNEIVGRVYKIDDMVTQIVGITIEDDQESDLEEREIARSTELKMSEDGHPDKSNDQPEKDAQEGESQNSKDLSSTPSEETSSVKKLILEKARKWNKIISSSHIDIFKNPELIKQIANNEAGKKENIEFSDNKGDHIFEDLVEFLKYLKKNCDFDQSVEDLIDRKISEKQLESNFDLSSKPLLSEQKDSDLDDNEHLSEMPLLDLDSNAKKDESQTPKGSEQKEVEDEIAGGENTKAEKRRKLNSLLEEYDKYFDGILVASKEQGSNLDGFDDFELAKKLSELELLTQNKDSLDIIKSKIREITEKILTAHEDEEISLSDKNVVRIKNLHEKSAPNIGDYLSDENSENINSREENDVEIAKADFAEKISKLKASLENNAIGTPANKKLLSELVGLVKSEKISADFLKSKLDEVEELLYRKSEKGSSLESKELEYLFQKVDEYVYREKIKLERGNVEEALLLVKNEQERLKRYKKIFQKKLEGISKMDEGKKKEEAKSTLFQDTLQLYQKVKRDILELDKNLNMFEEKFHDEKTAEELKKCKFEINNYLNILEQNTNELKKMQSLFDSVEQ